MKGDGEKAKREGEKRVIPLFEGIQRKCGKLALRLHLSKMMDCETPYCRVFYFVMTGEALFEIRGER